MNEQIKEQWTVALRSGEYKQGMLILREGDTFCCLGVLCDLHAKAGLGEWRMTDGRYKYLAAGDYGDDAAVATLPVEVMDWAGIDLHLRSTVRLPTSSDSLVALNDNGHSFKQIADIIEKEL